MADKYDVFDQLGELENTLNTTLTQISGIRQVLESSMTENATLRMELEKLRDRLAEFEKKEVKKEVETKLDFTTDIEFIMKSVKRKAG